MARAEAGPQGPTPGLCGRINPQPMARLGEIRHGHPDAAPQGLGLLHHRTGGHPALHARPGGVGAKYDLEVVVRSRQMGLLTGNPAIRRLHTYRNNPLYRLRLALSLGRTRFERLLVLHSNSDVIKLIKRLRYDSALNIQGWERPELNLEAASFPELSHFIDQRLALARLAGAEPNGLERMRIFLTPGELRAGEAWLRQQGLDLERPLTGFCPGASHAYKRWPADYFARVVEDLEADGGQTLLVGSHDEADLLAGIKAASGDRSHIALGLDLRLLAAVLAKCHLLISNCTGPLHLGQAVDTPVLGLFGPTDSGLTGPRGSPTVFCRPPTCVTSARRNNAPTPPACFPYCPGR